MEFDGFHSKKRKTSLVSNFPCNKMDDSKIAIVSCSIQNVHNANTINKSTSAKSNFSNPKKFVNVRRKVPYRNKKVQKLVQG